MSFDMQPYEVCPHCKNEIDIETCQCGDGRNGHPYDVGHSFVPAGCTCGYKVEEKDDESI